MHKYQTETLLEFFNSKKSTDTAALWDGHGRSHITTQLAPSYLSATALAPSWWTFLWSATQTLPYLSPPESEGKSNPMAVLFSNILLKNLKLMQLPTWERIAPAYKFSPLWYIRWHKAISSPFNPFTVELLLPATEHREPVQSPVQSSCSPCPYDF